MGSLFELTKEEIKNLRSQFAISSCGDMRRAKIYAFLKTWQRYHQMISWKPMPKDKYSKEDSSLETLLDLDGVIMRRKVLKIGILSREDYKKRR